MTEDVYEGRQLPAGTTVFGNIWAILHDPVKFPRPDVFDPAHFIPSREGGLYVAADDRPSKARQVPDPDVAFGFGRRLCPGRSMAMSTVWLVIASVLSSFDICKERDEDGAEVRLLVRR